MGWRYYWSFKIFDRDISIDKTYRSRKFFIGVRISPEISDLGIILDDSMKLVEMLRDEYIDFLHLSCWDIYKNQNSTLPTQKH